MNAGAWCPAGYEVPNGATWRCNLLPGHVGLHDDGAGDQWADDTTTPGPDRLRVAAVNLLGSYAAWDELRPALEKVLGSDLAKEAVGAIADMLRGWAKGEAR